MAVTVPQASMGRAYAQVGARRRPRRARPILRSPRALLAAISARFAESTVKIDSVDTCNSVGIIRSHRSVQEQRDFADELGSVDSGEESADTSQRGVSAPY